MTTQIQRRRGTTAQHSTFTGANGEVTVDTDKEVLVVHDGAQAGGYPQMRENGSNSALALGSAATPSLKFTGDTNTGIYSPGADQVAISTNGFQRLFVGDNGRIGIGVATPSTPLHIVNSGAANILLVQQGDDSATNTFRPQLNLNKAGTNLFILGCDGGASATGVTYYDARTATGQHLFLTNNTERMRLDSSGRLGLGTSSPGELLELSATADPRIRFVDVGNSDAKIGFYGSSRLGFEFAGTERMSLNSTGLGIGITAVNAPLEVRKNGAGMVEIARFSNYNGDGHQLGISVDDDNDLVSYASTGYNAGGHVWRAGNTERMRLTVSGQLLVGTSTAIANSDNNPNAKLHLHSSTYYSIDCGQYSADLYGTVINLEKSRSASVGSHASVSNGDQLGSIRYAGSDGTGFKGAALIEAYVDGTPGTNDMPGRLVFSTTADGASSPTERMRITSTGQVRLAGAGITFNGDTATANELDDYEEGTWTPTQGGGLTLVGAYSSQGFYTKTGNTVVVFGSLFGATSIASSAAGILCGGLPFTPAPPTAGYVVGSMTNQGGNISNTCFSLNSTNAYGAVAVAANSGIHFTMTYRVA